MLNLERIRALPPLQVPVAYSRKDVALYALSIGMGAPSDAELKYVFDEKLKCTPMFAMVLAHQLPWLRDPENGIDVRRMLHGESSLEVHHPLPAACAVVVHGRITQVVDRGPGKSVSIYFEQRILQSDGGHHMATVGGCFVFPGAGVEAAAGTDRPDRAAWIPDGIADAEETVQVPANAAQLYRLNGDRNTLHVDPEMARRAGFPKPILHGLCTFGYAGAAAIRTVCDGDVDRIGRIQARYSSPIYPGERLRTQFYRAGHGQYSFRCIAEDRNVTVLDAGQLALREPQ